MAIIPNRMIVIFFAILSIHSSYQHCYVSENDIEWYLINNTMEVCISKIDGNITSIIVNNKNLLSDSCWTGLSKIPTEKIRVITNKSVNNNSPSYCQIFITKDYPDKLIEYKYTIDSLALYWSVSVTAKLFTVTEINVDFFIPLIKNMQYLFYTNLDAPLLLKNFGEKKVTYRKNLTLPIMIFYNFKEDYGLSIIAPFEIPKPGLSFSIDEEKLTVSYYHLDLINNRSTEAAIYIVPHKGGWRPGLEFLTKRYPEYFNPVVCKNKFEEGWYAQGRPSDTEANIKKAKKRHVQWIELLYYFPFFGLYAPKLQNWGLVFNSDDISLDNWEKGAGINRNSYENTINLINLWQKYDVRVYLYFQSFEAWHQYAKKYFTNDIATDNNGNPHPSWKFTNLMNPDPSGKWGRYIIAQADDLMKKYPEIDGIFYDRLDYWNYDYAHDDGVTMINSKSTYMLGFALEKINEKIFDIFHKNKKGIWGNGPTSIEVCKNLDGIMAEGYIHNLYKIQHLGLKKPIIYLPYDKQPKDTEEKLKNALLCGAFPAITYGDIKCLKLDEKYRSLFDLIKNREWVLTKNPVEILGGFKSNIFRTPEGDYVVVIISPEKSQLTPHPFEYNVPITVNIPDANEINYAYLLSGDWSGVNTINFKSNDKAVKINLPYHLSSSLIYLTKKRKYNLVQLSSPILIKGNKKEIIFHVSNFKSKNPGSIEIITPWFKETKNLTSDVIKFHTTVPQNLNGEVEITIRYSGEDFKISYWSLAPVSIAPKEDIFIYENNQNVSFVVSNNLAKKITIGVKVKFIKGAGNIKTPNKISLQPLESREINFSVTTKKEGKINIILDANGQKMTESFSYKVGLFHEKEDLFFDNFSKGMNKWTTNRGKWEISKGIASGSGTSHFAFVKKNWSDYVLEVTTRCKGSDNPAVDWFKSYIFFRVQDENNFYRFGIHGGYEMVSLYKYIKGKWSELTKTPFSAQKGRWYTLKVEVHGNKIIGYLNGEVMIETTDNTFPSGGIGIGVLEDWMVTDYKNIIVKKS